MRALKFDRISFSYQPGKPIFDNISCVLASRKSNEGHVIALMGASGSGKSTLLKLILNTLSPNNGTIQYDPHEPIISYVPQDSQCSL